MDRRKFFSVTSVGAAAVAAGSVGGATAEAAGPANMAACASAKLPPLKARLGHQFGTLTDRSAAWVSRYGVDAVCTSPKVADPARLYPTADEMNAMLDIANKHKVKVELVDSVLLTSSLIDKEKNPAIMLAQSPQRDRDIEAFQTLIRNCAAVGIPAVKYNMSILGVLRNMQIAGRGDAQYTGWDISKAPGDQPLTRAGVVDADTFWERISYFLERVVPVANEFKVRIACHPQDPGVPAGGYRGVNRVLGTVEGLKRFVAIHESPYHGLNFCQGTISEDLADPAKEIFDVIRYFGSRRKIFNVHFRNIRGRRDRFVETFPDEGDVDMVQAALTYREVGYEGMLMTDHVPLVPVRHANGEYANLGEESSPADGHLESFAFGYGYIRAIIQAAERFG